MRFSPLAVMGNRDLCREETGGKSFNFLRVKEWTTKDRAVSSTNGETPDFNAWWRGSSPVSGANLSLVWESLSCRASLPLLRESRLVDYGCWLYYYASEFYFFLETNVTPKIKKKKSRGGCEKKKPQTFLYVLYVCYILHIF